VVREVDVPGVQLDEAYSKRRPRQVAWIHTALAMRSGFLLWVDVGPRTQEQAAALVAQVVARRREGPIFLTEAGKPRARHGSRSWVWSIVADVGGRWGASRNQGLSPPTTCATPKSSRSATRRGRWWRCADESCSAGPAALGSRCACENSAPRSRPPSWSDGMGPYEGWSHRCGAAPTVCPGAVPAAGHGSG
jgi:hypothetical protein